MSGISLPTDAPITLNVCETPCRSRKEIHFQKLMIHIIIYPELSMLSNIRATMYMLLHRIRSLHASKLVEMCPVYEHRATYTMHTEFSKLYKAKIAASKAITATPLIRLCALAEFLTEAVCPLAELLLPLLLSLLPELPPLLPLVGVAAPG